MFSAGHTVNYGTCGVCRIEEIAVRDCGGGKKEYYVLRPIYDKRSTLYVPTDSEPLISKMRELLTKGEILSIIDAMPESDSDWIADDKERAEIFRSLIECGSRTEIVKVIRMLYFRKKELSEKGRRLRSSDESIMQRAEKLIYGEFGWVLGLPPADVPSFISERLNEN